MASGVREPVPNGTQRSRSSRVREPMIPRKYASEILLAKEAATPLLSSKKRLRFFAEPDGPCIATQDDRHPVVEVAANLVRVSRDDRERPYSFVGRRSPGLPKSNDRSASAIARLLLLRPELLPFVKRVDRHYAATPLECFTEDGLRDQADTSYVAVRLASSPSAMVARIDLAVAG